ncbi:MAG: hypothetical protein JO313_10435 [Verrucomicrobia bacterium]|nr:hypothetical protein [Verrucomicrobiota bacterium]
MQARFDKSGHERISSSDYAHCARIASPARAFARHRLWLVIVPSIIVLRAPEMSVSASEFFKNGLFVWFAGALLLFEGLLIIAFTSTGRARQRY